ncbi:hypothetical protein [Rhodococcus chondri]|uniref:Uncharacterized protein n=1 Tax=Rhodococcus chondri TaxID=3065941 RepID=A0ABU7JMR1_9NOCA|nr:hypothetical protein [Rhodococcus sp. CC-R104]MEE2031337.1 hypothetical protein [Rhodococcus sp. CC-R104]
MIEYSRLEPHVIGEITAICKTMLDELDIAREIAQDLRRTEGFGDFESAKQLAAGYARKGAGTPESARERIDQFIENLTALRDAFASGGQAFIDANSDWAQRLRAMEEQSFPQASALSTDPASG